jgi:dTDP-4-dehydrorhamnose 3,5-epimerase-like enzyme
MVRVKKTPRIETRDSAGWPNGFLLPIYNVHEPFLDPAQHPKQVYCTVVAPRSAKGPHLHLKRWALFTCILGNVDIIVRAANDIYETYSSGDLNDFQTVQVPAGFANAIVNRGDQPAYVLNMPSPAWRPDDQDDHPVHGWTHPFFTDRA